MRERLLRGDDLVHSSSGRIFDPIGEGERLGLAVDVAKALWSRVRRETTSSDGTCDEMKARERFLEEAKRIAARGGRPGPVPFKWTQLDVASGVVGLGEVTPTLVPGRRTSVLTRVPGATRARLDGVPGRTTLVAESPDSDTCTPEESRALFRRYASGVHAALSKLDRAVASRDDYAAVVAMLALKDDLTCAHDHLANGLAGDEALQAELVALGRAADVALTRLFHVRGASARGTFGPSGEQASAASHVTREVEVERTEPAGEVPATFEPWSTRDAEPISLTDGHTDVGRESHGPSRARGGLPVPIRDRMERAFGRRFDDVELHPDSAEVSAGQLALTRGRHIHLEPGAVDLTSTHGERVIAHELAHVAQQDNSGARAAGQQELEWEAARSAALAVQGQAVRVALRASPMTAYAFSDEHEPHDDFEALWNGPDNARANPRVGDLVTRARTSGAPLDSTLRLELESALGVPLDAVRVHTSADADAAAHALGALAFTVDDDVFFRAGAYDPELPAGQRVIAHEVAHTVQARGTKTDLDSDMAINPEDSASEQEADAFADAFVSRFTRPGRQIDSHGTDVRSGPAPLQHPDAPAEHGRGVPDRVPSGGSVLLARTPPGISLHPAEKVLRYTIKWLSKRGTKTVSKHIARHARRIAGRAIHSVFRQPKNIKSMIDGAVKEAVALAARHATRPVHEGLEEGAIKILQQATGTPGKVRWVVQKTFRQEIGTHGERILRIVIDQSGRIVSAFPTDRLIAVGFSVGTVGILGERSAAAAERARSDAERNAAREDSSSSWLDFVPLIGDIWGGELNSGEAEELRVRDELEREIRELVAEIEAEENRRLTVEERRVVDEIFRAAIAAPLLHEADEEESL